MSFLILIIILALGIALAGGPFNFLFDLCFVVGLSLIADLTIKPWLHKRSRDITRPKAQKFIEKAVKDGHGTREEIERHIKRNGLSDTEDYFYNMRNPYHHTKK